jgi:hypothetical protein
MMLKINDIEIDERSLNCLKDKQKGSLSLTYFKGAILEMSLAETAPEIYGIWQEARRNLHTIYEGSVYGEEDFFVLDMELARSVRQRARQLGLVYTAGKNGNSQHL